MNTLKTGVAYHGNRILKHVQEDMADIVNHNMNVVLHMFSHNDWDRHLGVMKDIVKITKYYGLEVWIDNWGIGGPPGDKSHFLQYHPESHQIMSDGTVDPIRSCYNSEAFVQFTKDWLDTVKEFGGETVMWDEPHLLVSQKNGRTVFNCCCSTCKKLFEERYNKPMPTELTEEVEDFKMWSIKNYFDKVTGYCASLGMKNMCGCMLGNKSETRGLITLEHMDNIGINSYWDSVKGEFDPYDFTYKNAAELVQTCSKAGKDSHIWIQGFAIPAGSERMIMASTDAAYDAGIRTIMNWSYRGAESNTYRCENSEYAWYIIGESMRRIHDRHMENLRLEHLKKYSG